jgi:hypothetical protein
MIYVSRLGRLWIMHRILFIPGTVLSTPTMRVCMEPSEERWRANLGTRLVGCLSSLINGKDKQGCC